MSTNAANVNGEGDGGAVQGILDRVLYYPRRFRQFLHEVRVELKQVTWPTRDDVKATTLVVIATVFFFGVYLYLVDQGVSLIVQEIFRYFKN